MPWTLYRYILADLLRVVALTTTVLVTVIAFGAAIKPLASDRLLDAAQTVKYIGLAIVPMLQFALPFAAGFGATLSFYRLTTDNEIQAMAASGISYRRILVPIAALGVVLTLLMVILTQLVIPRFWSMIVQTMATDVTRMFQVSIERGEAFQIGSMPMIYADQLVVQENPEGTDGPQTRMILLNVAAADLDEHGRIVTDVTARRATVDIYRRGGQTLLKMVMHETVALNADTGQLVYSERFAPQRAMAVPLDTSETVKALTITRMRELRRNPDLFGRVVEAREGLADALREVEVRASIAARLAAEGRVELHDISGAAPARRSYLVHAARITTDGTFEGPRRQPIEVMQFENGIPTLRLLSESVQLVSAATIGGDTHAFDLMIGEHDVINLQHHEGAVNRRGRLVIPSVAVQVDGIRDLSDMSSAELIEEVEALPSARGRPQQRLSRLHYEIDRLHREITARMLNRFALSVTAFLLLMLGVVMPLWQRGSLPLVIYAWAFIPAVADLILISAGEQVLRDGEPWGHAIMWSGNALLLVIGIIAYRRVSRN